MVKTAEKKSKKEMTPEEKEAAKAAAKAERAEAKKNRPNYAETEEAKAITNADGRLTAVPTDFNFNDYQPLKREHFADEALYFDFRAIQAEEKAEQQVRAAEKFRAQAETYRKFGDPATRQMAMKAEKMRAHLAELEAALAAQGVA